MDQLRHPASMNQASLIIVIALVLGAVPFIDPAGSFNAPVMIMALTYVYGCWRLAETIMAPQPRWASLMFWLYCQFILVLPAAVQLNSGRLFWTSLDRFDDGTVLVAALLIAVGVAGTDLASTFAGRHQEPPEPARPHLMPALPICALLVSLVMTPAVLIGFGLEAAFQLRGSSDLSYAEQIGTTATVHFLYGLSAVVVAALALMVAHVAVLRTLRLRVGLTVWLTLAIVAACYLLTSWPPRLPRFIVGAHALVFVMTVATFAPRWRLRAYRAVGIAFAPLLYSVFIVASAFQRGSTQGDIRAALEQVTQPALTRGDFADFQTGLMAVSHVQDVGLAGGRGLLSAALWFIPRDLWPDKAWPSGVILAAHEKLAFLSVSTAWWMEWFLDFGTLGVFAGALVLGYALVWLDRRAQRPTFAVATFAAITFVAFLPILLRGPLLGVGYQPFVLTLAMGLMLLTVRAAMAVAPGAVIESRTPRPPTPLRSTPRSPTGSAPAP